MDLKKLDADLRVAEGVRYTAYKDSKGYWTAGVGHFLDQSIDWTGRTFSSDQVEAWLVEDIATATRAASSLMEWPSLDTDMRQNAVVELVFNMGAHTWETFSHTRLALASQNWQVAHDELLNSLWAKQVKDVRAGRISGYILNG